MTAAFDARSANVTDATRADALCFARSGAMALTGRAESAPSAAPASVAARADLLAANLRLGAGGDAFAGLDGAALLGERAALLGLRRRGPVSPGGSCRLLRTADGWLAPNLLRAEDLALLPAWLESRPRAQEGTWAFVAREVRDRSARELVARARWMGLAIAQTGERRTAPESSMRRQIGSTREAGSQPALVIDLSSLWAGPLCTQLLQQGGARVVKVESVARPDGARRGAPAFFDLLNADKASVAFDFASTRGRDALSRLIAVADVVVEASRPRALRQLGIDADACIAERPGLVWISITGHGRDEPEGGWVGFGDDAAVAAGLADAVGDAHGPLFCADAVADPLAGLEAAVEATAARAAGGGCRIDVSLVGAAGRALTTCSGSLAAVRRRGRDWFVEAGDQRERVAPPRARRPRGRARRLGADTDAVLREMAGSC